MKQIKYINDKEAIIEGDNIKELINESLLHIRFRSKEYYQKELLLDLQKQSYSWIDHHAGIGVYYKVKLINPKELK